MQEEENDKKTKLDSIEEVLDRMLYGAKTPREARLQKSLDRYLTRRNRKIKKAR